MGTGCSAHRALNQSTGKVESGTKFLFTARHLPSICFVIVSGKVQQTVEHQHLDFDAQRVAAFISLSPRYGNADGQVAGDLCRPRPGDGKRKHIGGFVLTPKLAIQTLDAGVCGQQHRDLAAQFHGSLRLTQKCDESPRTRNALVPWCGEASRPRCSLRNLYARRGSGVQIWVEKDHRARGRYCSGPVSSLFYANAAPALNRAGIPGPKRGYAPINPAT